jgi:S-adenosylmethionine synthetase
MIMEMNEKVSPQHPDKIADRIAGALVDYAVNVDKNAKCAYEVLIGHGACVVMGESSIRTPLYKINEIVYRIAGDKNIRVSNYVNEQDVLLAKNQADKIRCGDNGVYEASPKDYLHNFARNLCQILYDYKNTDGKLIIDDMAGEITVCWSNLSDGKIKEIIFDLLETKSREKVKLIINPLGRCTGGINVDTGATNRKLGSDLTKVNGGGIHGKDLSKADVSCNIYAYLLAIEHDCDIFAKTSIGDDKVKFYDNFNCIADMNYESIVSKAQDFIDNVGGFEKLAEWGLW